MSHDLAPHPLRRQVLDELHARPFQLVDAPRRVLHLAFSTAERPAAAERAALARWCEATGAARPEDGANFHRAAFPTSHLRWERHSEFSTYGWDVPAPGGDPFHWPLAEPSPVGVSIDPPGPLLVAIDLALVRAADLPPGWHDLFDPASLCISALKDETALIATDFRQDARGFTRILVVDRSLTPVAAGSLIQRLLEVETYRCFALLGLPEAQRMAPVIGRIERELVAVAQRMKTATGLESNAALLDTLVAQAAELEAEAALSSFRFGATRAYEALVRSRLAVIGEIPVEGHSTWVAFLDRRFAPAMRTCQTMADRQAELSQKLARAANLLRTRVDIALEEQNRTLLQTMSDRARLQLRLQQTVEGLSIAAVSYYVLGLLGYLFKGGKDAGFLPFEPTVATAAVLPFVVIAMAMVVRRIRRSHGEH
ncbi:MAG: DUF3422 domain-containing protein [Phreatobacter sp.]|uniref:DUF3422 family protein n=1 Tax=Phreatobacter sp. TaxID=1966341 RepID=UPI001A607270|nr:DUF3422 domain-containing protein [Phreatobacter sp.]MBL8568874.1 DUF3422 domain-containing protein [Phreatobacter sp.]